MGNRDRLSESNSKRCRDECDGDFPIGNYTLNLSKKKEQTKR
jgi:hypothetical protein